MKQHTMPCKYAVRDVMTGQWITNRNPNYRGVGSDVFSMSDDLARAIIHDSMGAAKAFCTNMDRRADEIVEKAALRLEIVSFNVAYTELDETLLYAVHKASRKSARR